MQTLLGDLDDLVCLVCEISTCVREARAHVLPRLRGQERPLHRDPLELVVFQLALQQLLSSLGTEHHAVHPGGLGQPCAQGSLVGVALLNSGVILRGKESFKRIKRELAEYICRSG